MRFGIDYLGGARYGKTILRNHPNGWGAGIFSNVDGFGDGLKVIAKLLAKGACPFVRIQLMWKDAHNFNAGDYSFVKKEARRVRALIVKFPHVQFYVSPVCEHNLSEKDWQKFGDIVRNELSGLNYVLVNSPIKTGKFKGVLNEYHHQKGGDAFSYDGANAFDSDVQSDKDAYANSVYFMFWNCQFNGKKKLDEKTPRAKRNAWPVKEQIESCVALAKPKGKTKSYVKKLICKSHADQHTDKPTGKDQKLVYISSLKVKQLTLKLNGKEIATLAYYGPFQGGGFRYYSQKWGYQIANQVCELWAENIKIADVNPAFRDFLFR